MEFYHAGTYRVDKWPEIDGKRIPWETCQTFSGSWGYYRDEYTWKSIPQLLGVLIETVGKGGNLLLNVGPTGRGTFDYRADQALKGIEEWMKFNSRSIYGCTEAPDEFAVPDNSLLTYNPKTNRLYIHLLYYPLQTLRLSGYKGKVQYAQSSMMLLEIKITEPPQRSRSGRHSKRGERSGFASSCR
jgi:alpha-L-fucosidase